MAQLGSVSGIAENALIVSGKKNEWSMASARSNCVCASAEQDVLKSTLPSFSGLLRWAGSVSAQADGTKSSDTSPVTAKTDLAFIARPPSRGTAVWALREATSYLILVISIARRKLSTLVPRACFPLIVNSVELNELPYVSLP